MLFLDKLSVESEGMTVAGCNSSVSWDWDSQGNREETGQPAHKNNRKVHFYL